MALYPIRPLIAIDFYSKILYNIEARGELKTKKEGAKMNWVSRKYYKILKDLTDENGSGFYQFSEKKIENLLSYLQKYFGERNSYNLYYSEFLLNHRFDVDVTEHGVVIAKKY